MENTTVPPEAGEGEHPESLKIEDRASGTHLTDHETAACEAVPPSTGLKERKPALEIVRTVQNPAVQALRNRVRSLMENSMKAKVAQGNTGLVVEQPSAEKSGDGVLVQGNFTSFRPRKDADRRPPAKKNPLPSVSGGKPANFTGASIEGLTAVEGGHKETAVIGGEKVLIQPEAFAGKSAHFAHRRQTFIYRTFLNAIPQYSSDASKPPTSFEEAYVEFNHNTQFLPSSEGAKRIIGFMDERVSDEVPLDKIAAVLLQCIPNWQQFLNDQCVLAVASQLRDGITVARLAGIIESYKKSPLPTPRKKS